jgi:hypothetical protein
MDTKKTVSDIMAAEQCDDYTREVVAEVVEDEITAEQCAALDIPIEDRLWAIIYVWLDDRQRRLLACDCAERALLRERAAGREPDERSWNVVRVARAYARGGATDEELAAAWYAAGDASGAAWSAAWYAAGDASGAAAWHAASAAAWAAAAAERQWQLSRALAYVLEEV